VPASEPRVDNAATGIVERPREASERQRPRPVSAPGSASGITRVVSAAAPTLGNPSLRINANFALGAASNVFKGNKVFLWSDGTGNTALGSDALSSANAFATLNTAVGHEALHNTFSPLSGTLGDENTAVGFFALRSNTVGFCNTATGADALGSNTSGYRNTATGSRSLYGNTSGRLNSAHGFYALHFNTTGLGNTGVGALALQNNTSGSLNIALGYKAGLVANGFSNIMIANQGVASEINTLRIGQGSGNGSFELTRAFIHGIRLRTTGQSDAIPVLIDSAGQLGTASSSRRFKQDIQDLGPLAYRLLDLRPVAFRYRQHVAADPEAPFEFGLLAEEVAEVLPELVVFDEEGRPETVKYHLLSSLLLGELQQQHAELERLRARLDATEARVRAGSQGSRNGTR
jgi:hypothetical protein